MPYPVVELHVKLMPLVHKTGARKIFVLFFEARSPCSQMFVISQVVKKESRHSFLNVLL